MQRLLPFAARRAAVNRRSELDLQANQDCTSIEWLLHVSLGFCGADASLDS
jgi:hypothetical protein